jgi:MinD-like ATPase involved in chromosome partitioning or flagellar assembly
VDLIPELVKGKRPDWKRLIRGTSLKDAKGSLDLLDAGDASSDEYGKQLAAIDWDASYKSEKIQLGERIEELRREWIRDYDFVLLDSRTGLTDIGGICTAQLPDLVVLVLAPNTQGLNGTLGALAKARKQRALLPLDRGDFMVLPVPSRFDPNAVGAELDKWTRVLAERLQPLYDEWRDKDTTVEKLNSLLRIPHVARWSLGEPLPVLLESADDPSSVSHAIATVAAFLARGLEGSKQLVEERNSYVKDVLERNRALLSADAEADAPKKFAYDLFLSFSGPDREFARVVALELSERGRHVFFDEQSIKTSARWANELSGALEQSRGVAAIIGGPISAWQRAEVEHFLELARADRTRAVIPVLRHGDLPDWPELFAFQAAKIGAGSPAEVASALHAALRRLDAPQQDKRAAAAPKLWTEKEALAAYREWLAKQHEKLIPYFDGAADLLLDETFVQVELEPTQRVVIGEMHGERLVSKRSTPERPRTLEDLLLPSERGPIAPRWLVIGEPGAGKTTLTRSLARSTAQSRPHVPIFMPLARVKTALDPLEFAVQDMLGDDAQRSARADVLRTALSGAAKRGELLFLLDGFDEVDPARMDKLLAEIVAYANANRSTSLAVTTRPIAIERRDIPSIFCRARVLALPTERQNELLSKLLGANEASRVRAHIAQHPALADLAASPLLLTLIAVVARDTVLAETSLPNTRSKLYETAIDLLLRRGFGVEKHGVRDTGHARRLLQKLSLVLHTQGGESWERKSLSDTLTTLRRQDDEANFLVKETWSTNDAFLDDIGTNSGVLGPHDGPNAPWRYLHRSLREFLAAEAIAREGEERIRARVATWAKETADWERSSRESRDKKAAKRDESTNPARWGEVFALLAGLLKDPTSLLDSIVEASADLALRTLPSIDALPPLSVATRFVRVEGWEPEQLDAMFKRWSLSAPSQRDLLWRAVSPELSIEALGRLWWMFERIGTEPPSRHTFFERSGRPLPEPRLLKWTNIPAGEFSMGSTRSNYDDERPVHRVTVRRFELATTTVTRAQWAAFELGSEERAIAKDAELPVTDVSWYAAKLFCAWLGARLPSEAEWEYACRAGTSTEYWSGDNEKDLARVGWYRKNSDNRVHAVGQKPANPWGLLDMHGNVWEWCEDTWHRSYGESGRPDDGRTWVDEASSYRVIRGGSFVGPAVHARSASRRGIHPSERWPSVGFRPARSVTTD